MGGKFGSSNEIGFSIYKWKLHATTTYTVDAIVAQFGLVQRDYVSKFDKSGRYSAYSLFKDAIITLRGVESAMCAALRNHIIWVDPQKMLYKVILTQLAGLLGRQEASEKCKKPVPPNIDLRLAARIGR